MKFSAILTLILLTTGSTMPLQGIAQARGDDAIVEMAQAFKKGDRKRLAALLPQVAGHMLEPVSYTHLTLPTILRV